jgi:hypothetical protein
MLPFRQKYSKLTESSFWRLSDLRSAGTPEIAGKMGSNGTCQGKPSS